MEGDNLVYSVNDSESRGLRHTLVGLSYSVDDSESKGLGYTLVGLSYSVDDSDRKGLRYTLVDFAYWRRQPCWFCRHVDAESSWKEGLEVQKTQLCNWVD